MTVSTAHFSWDEQQTWHDQAFPLGIQYTGRDDSLETVCSWARDRAAEFTRLAAEHGAVLFRGFPIQTPEDFDQFIQAFGYENFPYKESLSNAVRVNLTDHVFTANEAPPEVTIFLHHEMAQTPIFPMRLFFYCDHAPDVGGATPLCRSDILWELIQAEQPDFASAIEAKGLRYTNVMPGSNDAGSGQGRSWQSTFGVWRPCRCRISLTGVRIQLGMAGRQLFEGDNAGFGWFATS